MQCDICLNKTKLTSLVKLGVLIALRLSTLFVHKIIQEIRKRKKKCTGCVHNLSIIKKTHKNLTVLKFNFYMYQISIVGFEMSWSPLYDLFSVIGQRKQICNITCVL